ncbi:glycoside hydrolase family 16 protein [Haloferula sargassicola]|uniref:Beta-glucanase n=1 Tax=Haloferula sargassicola TaxID=490096 RepID=A0ABP9UJH7_9BACT
MAGGAGRAEENTPAPPAGWTRVWADEFDRDGVPDPARWEFEHGFQRNHELQWYQPDNAVVRDGRLVIEARRQQVRNPGFREESREWRASRRFAEYTSASLITRPEVAWTYGRFEIRARFPARAGLWPAIWTTGKGRWPQAGEIDIMEFYRGQLLANFVQAGPDGRDVWNDSRHPLADFEPWEGKDHLWVMEWDEEKIEIRLDGRLLNRHDLSRPFPGADPALRPFHAPQRLRLNMAVGGQGGDPSGTTFPQRYEIDFVRIYQREK